MTTRLNRRSFLHTTGAAGLTGAGLTSAGLTSAGLTGESATAGLEDVIPIIDTHQHLWDLNRFTLPWLENNPALARSYVMKDYMEATAGLSVVKTVYMEVDVDPSQQVQEAAYVTELCRRPDNPMVGAVISGRPASDGFAAYMARFHNNPFIKGVRQVLHVPSAEKGTCLLPAFIDSMHLLGRMNLNFDMCVRAPEIPDFTRMVDRCPGTRFILDHCGNPGVQNPDHAQWRRDIAEMAKRPHVYCKISGIVASAHPVTWKPQDLEPFVNHCIDQFGSDRVVYGGDWPVCTLAASYRQWVAALRWIIRKRPAADQKKLLHDNAIQAYRLS